MEVELLVLVVNVPTLLSVRDMLKHNLYISIKDTLIIFEGKREPLTMKRYLLTYSWAPGDINFAMYTEDDLRKFRRNLGNH